MYEVVLSSQAQKIYASADQALAKNLARCFEQLEQSPRYHPNIKPLKGDFAGYYRYRIGDYSNSHVGEVQIDPSPNPSPARRGEQNSGSPFPPREAGAKVRS